MAQLDWEPRPRDEVVRGAYNNPNRGANELMDDGQAAFAHALQWYVTRDPAHAEKSIEILNAWTAELRAVGGHDARLLVGMAGINHVGAAELMRRSAGPRARIANPSITEEKHKSRYRGYKSPVV